MLTPLAVRGDVDLGHPIWQRLSLPLGRYTGGRSRVFRVTFADEFRVNPHFDLEADYIIIKGI